MQAELRAQLDALQISMEAEARRADAAKAERSRAVYTTVDSKMDRGLCTHVRG